MTPSVHLLSAEDGMEKPRTNDSGGLGSGVLDKSSQLVEWETGHATDNPICWSVWKKTQVMAIISCGSLCVTCASSVVSSAYSGLERDLHTSRQVVIVGLSLYVIGLGLGPCLLAPFSEFYGRRPVYIVSFGAFFFFGLPVAFANNLPVFLVFRFLTGFAGSAFLSVAGGSVSDMWLPKDSMLPMACYTCTPFLGPVLGPVYGGFIESFGSTWRWCFYVVTMWSFVIFLLLIGLAPETFAPILLSRRAKELRDSTGSDCFYAQYEREMAGKSLARTIAISGSRVFLLLFLEPMMLLLCLWCSVMLAILYLFFELYPIAFAQHNFQAYQTGLAFLGIGLGILCALGTAPYWAGRFKNKAEETGGVPAPESALDMAKVGSLLTPAGLFIFAFTSYPGIHWAGPVVGSVLFGWALVYIYISVNIYSVAQWRHVAASAMGANSALRSCFAAVLPLVSTQMTNRLGVVGTAAMLAGINCLIIPLPFAFAHYGPHLRTKSRFTQYM